MADIKNTQYEGTYSDIQIFKKFYTYTAVTINKLSLTEEDFRRLKEGEWLNCKVSVYIHNY